MVTTLNIIDELTWRGAINQQTDEEGLKNLIDNQPISVYCGIDPTGDSMHIGHLIPFMMMKRFAKEGHHAYILIGGATGSIGDPSGKNTERKLQTKEQVEKNVASLTAQMKNLFAETENITILNNNDWFENINLLDFLRDYGKHVNVNTMLAKDIVANRLETGISFTEFAYQILQGVDFLKLYEKHNVQLQIGGADQWGNITTGTNLIHKILGNETKVYGLTIPLMVKADGTKFGKTAGGAVWLDRTKTSSYEFYQFWYNQDDRDVIKYLKYFTFLSEEEIAELEKAVQERPEKREAQRKLAQEVTSFVHGDEAVYEAEKISEILFSGQIQELTTEQIAQAFASVPNVDITSGAKNLVDFLVEYKIEPSKRQAREDVKNGAIYINGTRIQDLEYILDPKDSFDGKYVVIRRGKKKYFLARVVD